MTNSSIEDLLNKRARPEDRMVYKPTGIYGGEMMIYSEGCDDPRTMEILDPVTKIVYDQTSASQQTPETRRRLVNHCREQGYNVMELWEAEEAIRRQRP